VSLPFRERSVSADGFVIRYLEAGDGPPLVCFHGAGGLRLSRSHELLAERYRVVAFEAPGFGQSPVNERSTTLRELAATMRQAMAALDIDHGYVWGTSFGGKLALWLAVDDPDRVDALVLESPAAIRSESVPLLAPGQVAAMLYAHPERQPSTPSASAEVVVKQQELVGRLIGPAREPELEEAMRHLDVATLVLFGDEDRLTPAELGRHYRELLPNCQFVIVHDAAHAIDGDRPEAFAAVVSEFVERHEQFVVRRESGLLYP
jgi:pimeloyl-ACP methyl ester carboxylesterase